ncbi:MAG: hypothetical protein MJ175_03490 [Clostridia bacterium]|nr:hypothetical protein [Clostridia bacterium]
MKNKFTQSCTLLLLAAAIAAPAVTMTGCGKKNEPVKSKPTNVYRSEVIESASFNYNTETSSAHKELENIYGVGDKVIITGYDYDDNWNAEKFSYFIDTTTGERSEVRLPSVGEDMYPNDTIYAANGTIWTTYGKWGYDEATDTYSEDLFLYHYAQDGSIIGSASVYDIMNAKKNEDYLYINNMTAVDDSLYLSMEQGLFVIGPDLSITGKVEINNLGYVDRVIARDKDLLISYTTSTDWTRQIVPLDPATMQMGAPIKMTGVIENNLYSAMPSETYDFVYSDTVGVYGYDIATDTKTELLNWINSDIDASSIRSTYIAPDGVIYAMFNDWETDTSTQTVMKMTRIPDEEVKEKYILTYGTLYLDYNMRKQIIAFNKQSEEYRIIIRDYSEYNTEDNQWTGGLTEFKNDLLVGNIPDILQITADMPYQDYANKGLFADLNPMIDADPTIDRADLYENILNAMTLDGKLYEIAPSFNVETIVGKSSIVGDNDGWTIEEMRKAAAAAGLEKDPFNGDLTREQFLTGILTLTRDQFVNKDTGECYFDTPEFIDILKYSAGLPEKSIYEDINWDEIDENFWTDREMAYRMGTAMLAMASFGDYRDFWRIQQGQFGEKISFVGFPNASRNGNGIMLSNEIAISSKSSCQEGAWAFLSYYLNWNKSQNPENSYQFSIFRSANEAKAQTALEYYDKWWNGGIIGGGGGIWIEDDMAVAEVTEENDDDTIEVPVAPLPVDKPAVPGGYEDWDPDEKHWGYYIGNQYIDIGMMTQDAVDHVNRMLESLTQVYRTDNTMMDIIMEEASAFYAGQKPAEEAARLIQSRVRLYVSESR